MMFPRRPAVLPQAGIFLSLALLIVAPSVSKAIALLLVFGAAGMVVFRRTIDGCDLRWLAVLSVLPVSYAFNLSLTGWDAGELDRPAHLVYGWFVYLMAMRCGVTARLLAVGAASAGAGAAVVAFGDVVVAGLPRAAGGWNAVPFGNYSLLLAFVSAAAWATLRPRSFWFRGVLLAGGAGGAWASLASGTRGGWLAVPVLVIIAGLAYKPARIRPRLAMLAGALGLCTLVVASMPSATERIRSAYEQAASFVAEPERSSPNSVGIRLAMWHWGLAQVPHHPWIGMGLSTFEVRRDEAVKRGELPAKFGRLSNLHNQIISDLATCGVAGVLALLIFWWLAWVHFWRPLRDSNDPEVAFFASFGLLAVAGTAVFSMTESLFGTSIGTFSLALLLGLSSGGLRAATRRASGAVVSVRASGDSFWG